MTRKKHDLVQLYRNKYGDDDGIDLFFNEVKQCGLFRTDTTAQDPENIGRCNQVKEVINILCSYDFPEESMRAGIKGLINGLMSYPIAKNITELED